MKTKSRTIPGIQVGDIGLVNGRTWLARAIKFFMNIFRIILKLPRRKLYNHAFLIIDVWGNLYVAEALAKGITIRPWKSSPYNGSNRIKMLRLKDELNKKEKEEISKYCISFALEPTRYDIFNFFFQILLILFGRWYGPSGEEAKKRLYCSEAVATWINEIRPGIFEKPEATNPLHIDMNENLKEVR